jgi:hypothetical protein
LREVYAVVGGSTNAMRSWMVFLSLPISSNPVFSSTSACFASSVRCSWVMSLKDLRSSLILWPTSLRARILTLQKHLDKAVNNALIAKTVELCADRHIEWIMYGRMGNHPTLDNFKQSNGFAKFQLSRYFMPLTGKGRFAIRLRLNRAERLNSTEYEKGALPTLQLGKQN